MWATAHRTKAAADKQLPPEPMEQDDDFRAPLPDENSRLSCQILWTGAYDGLTVSLPWPCRFGRRG
jgi:ferredoxin